MKKLAVLFALLFSSLSFADSYIVILKNKPSSVQALKDETYQHIQQMSTTLNSLPVFQPFEMKVMPERVLWVVHGFSATLTQTQYDDLMASGEVASITKSRKMFLFSDSESSATWGVDAVKATELRQRNPDADGTGITVGVIDSGVDPTHPDLAGKVVGWNDFVTQKPDPYDDNGHGTHVSGTIAGGGTSGTAIGVAPGVKLVEAKVFGPEGSADEAVILSAMQWMTDQKVDLVSNSWGGSQDSKDIDSDPFYKACDTWRQASLIPVFAAGNFGPDAKTIGTPGGFPNVIAVGAVDDKSVVATFSSRGPISWTSAGKTKSYAKPDVVAPGVNVYSAAPGGGYAYMSGTSMATPHTAGTIALILQAHHNLSYDEVYTTLTTTAKNLGAKNTYGHGLIDAEKAVLGNETTKPLF